MRTEDGFVVVPLEGRGMGCIANRWVFSYCSFSEMNISVKTLMFFYFFGGVKKIV